MGGGPPIGGAPQTRLLYALLIDGSGGVGVTWTAIHLVPLLSLDAATNGSLLSSTAVDLIADGSLIASATSNPYAFLSLVGQIGALVLAADGAAAAAGGSGDGDVPVANAATREVLARGILAAILALNASSPPFLSSLGVVDDGTLALAASAMLSVTAPALNTSDFTSPYGSGAGNSFSASATDAAVQALAALLPLLLPSTGSGGGSATSTPFPAGAAGDILAVFLHLASRTAPAALTGGATTSSGARVLSSGAGGASSFSSISNSRSSSSSGGEVGTRINNIRERGLLPSGSVDSSSSSWTMLSASLTVFGSALLRTSTPGDASLTLTAGPVGAFTTISSFNGSNSSGGGGGYCGAALVLTVARLPGGLAVEDALITPTATLQSCRTPSAASTTNLMAGPITVLPVDFQRNVSAALVEPFLLQSGASSLALDVVAVQWGLSPWNETVGEWEKESLEEER